MTSRTPLKPLFGTALCLLAGSSVLSAQQAAPATPTVLPEVTVTAESPSYSAPTATTATHLDTPLRDIPQAINVIPRQVIEDRGISRVGEVADSVPGVQTQSGYGGLPSGSYFIRGFAAYDAYQDGMRKSTFLAPMDVAGLERVEFLKGPASVLYGQNQPGGIVNFVSKRPVQGSLAELGFTYGSFETYRATADFGGTLLSRDVPGSLASLDKNPKSPAPVTGGGEPVLTYRLVGAYENSNSYRDYNQVESYYIAPSLKWDIDKDTSLVVYGEYQKYDFTFDRGLLPVAQSFQVPISRFIGDPANRDKTETWRAGYEFNHRFDNDWQFRSAFAASGSEGDALFAQPGDLAPDGRTVLRNDTRRHEKAYNFTLQNEISGKFDTGPVSHHLLLGTELTYFEFEYDLNFGRASTIDLFNPVYNYSLDENIPHVPWDGTSNKALGVYLQDQVTITDQIKLLAGLRYDYVESRDDYGAIFEHNDAAFSPRVGIVYQPIEPVSIFAGWSRAFNPNSGASKTGGGFDPEQGEQYEAGLKFEFVKDKLSSTLAFFDITKQNVLTTDPTDPNFSVLTGEVRSKGFEYDLVGTPIPGWNIIASYAYTDAYVSKDNFVPVGSSLVGSPENQAGLWTSYQIQDGTFKGLGVGAGVYYMGDRAATLPASVTLPEYWRVDASIFYRRQQWSAQVNFKNITNEKIYQSQGYLIVPDAPFNVQATITYRF